MIKAREKNHTQTWPSNTRLKFLSAISHERREKSPVMLHNPYRSDEYNYKNNHSRIENHVKMRIRTKKKTSGFYVCTAERIKVLPVMALSPRGEIS